MSIFFRRPERLPEVCLKCGEELFAAPWQSPCPNCGHFAELSLVARSRQSQRPPIHRAGVESLSERPFTPEAWRSGSLRERGAMARDLVRRCVLLGLSESQVLELLGWPERKGNSWTYALYVGVRITHLGTPHTLQVRFDKSSLVSDAAFVD